MDTRQTYLRFAEQEASEKSPYLEALANLVIHTDELVAFLERLPVAKRQPNLFFGAVRFLAGELLEGDSFKRFVAQHPSQILRTMIDKRTQTNEPARTATLLPVLSQIEGPIALMEVGASAGLCLLPDYYAYSFDTICNPATHQSREPLASAHTSSSSPVFHCQANAKTPLPIRMPDVIWRRGLDLNPLNVGCTDDMNWLRALIWPEQNIRLKNFDLAVAVACQHKLQIDTGDLIAQLRQSIQSAPSDARLVIFHSAVLAYAPRDVRSAFQLLVSDIDCLWISNEHPGLFPDIAEKTQCHLSEQHFLLSVNGQPLAETGPHGQSIDWLADAPTAINL